MLRTRRYLGLLAVLFALAANWLLPALHTPCAANNDHPEHGRTFEQGEQSDHRDSAHHEDATPDQHTHRDNTNHDESRCGLCQIMFLGTIAPGTSLLTPAFCGFAPRVAIISIASQHADSYERPHHISPRGPPAA